jgi:Tfp pilus assembly protein PilN
VKAVNLIPADQRRGATGPSRSGGAVYALLGGLALVVVAVAVYVVVANQVSSRKDDLHRLQAQTQAAQAEANALAPYRKFASLKQARVQTIQSLAASRFDWQRVMRKLAVVIPSNVWLTSLVGTVAPGVQLQSSGGGGGSGDSSGLRSAMAVPAVELSGCTTGQAEVSRFMSRLRVIDGVTRVSLVSSAKSDTGGGSSGGTTGSSGGSGGSTKCESEASRHPQFDLVVFFAGAVK